MNTRNILFGRLLILKWDESKSIVKYVKTNKNSYVLGGWNSPINATVVYIARCAYICISMDTHMPQLIHCVVVHSV